MVFNDTFNNISVIWWWSVLLVEETVASHSQTLSHNVVSSTMFNEGTNFFLRVPLMMDKENINFFHLLRYINECSHVNI